MTEDSNFETFLRIVIKMRSLGGSIRAIAKCFGMSKSQMGRLVQALEAADASQLGQLCGISAAIPTSPPQSSVPDGTKEARA